MIPPLTDEYYAPLGSLIIDFFASMLIYTNFKHTYGPKCIYHSIGSWFSLQKILLYARFQHITWSYLLFPSHRAIVSLEKIDFTCSFLEQRMVLSALITPQGHIPSISATTFHASSCSAHSPACNYCATGSYACKNNIPAQTKAPK